MIAAAGTLVLLGLAMFVAGLATGATAFFWGCVAVCVVAAVLLVLARRHMGPAPDGAADEEAALPATAVVAAATSETPGSGRRTRRAPAESVRRTAELPAVPPPAGPPADQPPTPVTPAVEPGDPETAIHEPPIHEPPIHEPPVHEPPVGRTAYYSRLSAHQPADPEPVSGAPTSGATTSSPGQAATSGAMPAVAAGEPPMEDIEVTDLLLIVDLKDEVLVVDEHPRYHLPGCPYLSGQETIPLPLDEARTDGFTPCGICSPDRTLAERERARK